MRIATIDYFIERKSVIDPLRVGTEAQLRFECRVADPASDPYTRDDTWSGNQSASVLLRQWEELTISVIAIKRGTRFVSGADGTELSRHLDFKEFYQSAADGQIMDFDATQIGALEQIYQVKLITSNTNQTRKRQTQQFSTTFKLRVVG